MRPSRLLLTPLAASFVLASAFAPMRTASILPEVQRHMDEAQKCARSGSFDFAIAHANLVLVSDELSVSLRFEGIPDSQQKNCSKALDAALSIWQKSLDNTIHFHREDDPAKADICVRFRPDVRMGKEAVAGFTNWNRTIHTDGNRVVDTSFKADVQVRARNLDAAPMTFNAMRQEAMHEIGHVLGLEDSDFDGDLMGPLDVARPVSAPQKQEIEAVRNLRDQARRIKADASASLKH